jgi:hypothetical protein
VAKLSKMILERWHWSVTQQDKQSFVVPFPSRGDLQWSVAFRKVDIKEHGVSHLFEEWKQEDEGLPLQRVWIRIFRLCRGYVPRVPNWDDLAESHRDRCWESKSEGLDTEHREEKMRRYGGKHGREKQE